MSRLESIRECLRRDESADEIAILKSLIASSQVNESQRAKISKDAAQLIRGLREERQNSLMEKFLAEYGLSTREGVALMCLAEALLRVPDSSTIDALIEDKIAFGEWREHLGQSPSGMINGSTWALLVTGKIIEPVAENSLSKTLRGLVKRLGEPVIRTAVAQAMKELGRQFVLGSSISAAIKRAKTLEKKGYQYSYDMLGEAALTADDAQLYFAAYHDAIEALSQACVNDNTRDNPGISVKLSALHPRYEFAQRERVKEELVGQVLALALQAKQANMGFNIDAEEAERLDLSLDVIEAVIAHEELAGWEGFGVVVQAFGQRAASTIEWLYELARVHDRKIMVRLVKGAYWDREIKRAQTLGLSNFPVYTRKVHTDIAYICCAENLLGMTDRIYPQFATHNAHSLATILELTQSIPKDQFEFQRLHGMGEALHDMVHETYGTRCRVYAPVGEHRDLLAYLVRRLLENGANSSFVNQVADEAVAPEVIAADPFLSAKKIQPSTHISTPAELYGTQRKNARGWDIENALEYAQLFRERGQFMKTQWHAKPMLSSAGAVGETFAVMNPADFNDQVGSVTSVTLEGVTHAIDSAALASDRWAKTGMALRAETLLKTADLFEENAPELFAILQREAGKSLADAIGEVREAVDFARYYALQAANLADENSQPSGIFCCISPWNFPLAIFAGQILAALVSGNAVLAKPAEQTPLIAARAVELMHQAGVPKDVLQLLIGEGAVIGAALTADSRVQGVCFTGSTATAMHINQSMARNLHPAATLIAETGGLNAMIVDSTALPEQVVQDVVMSAFQSAGQRCSALRLLYVQEDVADNIITMLSGAMDELSVGDPWHLSNDIGPVIDAQAQASIQQYIDQKALDGLLIKQLPVPTTGYFIAPTMLRVSGIEALETEIFGPVLHVATYSADELDQVVEAINDKGYGLTFGLHTRIDRKVEAVTQAVNAGNIYVNRNQIGAIVGTQPFGGEGLSGTGPKAGGPNYLHRFRQQAVSVESAALNTEVVTSLESLLNSATRLLSQMPTDADDLLNHFSLVKSRFPSWVTGEFKASEEMPGPTGESNQLSWHPRGIVLCLGPTAEQARMQAATALAAGNVVVCIAPGCRDIFTEHQLANLPVILADGLLAAEALIDSSGYSVVACNADERALRDYRKVLANKTGEIIPLVTESADIRRFILERHVCIDTTAAGGNASLIAAAE